jgi:superfamily II DNA or RNA helicase
MVISGLFGPISKVATSRELMDKGYLAELDIKCIVLSHSAADSKKVKDMTYQEEIEFLFTMEKRNEFIVDLVDKMKGNVLVLCQYVDKHAIPLHDMMRQKIPPHRNVYLIIGKVDPEEREKIRKILETETDAVLVASIKSFATGSNVKNIRHVIFTAPTKSMVTTLQSIGRAIRKSPTKTKATLHDIADNLTYKGRKNFAQEHFLKRLQIYAVEKFPYKIFNIGLDKNE